MQSFNLSNPISKKEMDEFTATLDNPTPEALAALEGRVIQDTQVKDPDEIQVQPDVAALMKELETTKQRHADGNRYINEIKIKAAQREKELLEEITAAKAKKPKYVSEEALKGFEEQFPDVAPFLKELDERTKQEAVAEATKVAKDILDERDRQAQANTEALKRLSLAHPDWPEYETDATPAGVMFAKWIEGQTQFVKGLLTSGDVDKYTYALDLFKSQVAPKKNSGTTKKQELTHSVQPSSPASVAGNPIMFDLKKWEQDWEKAMRRSNQKKMAELITDYEQAERENRLPH